MRRPPTSRSRAACARSGISVRRDCSTSIDADSVVINGDRSACTHIARKARISLDAVLQRGCHVVERGREESKVAVVGHIEASVEVAARDRLRGLAPHFRQRPHRPTARPDASRRRAASCPPRLRRARVGSSATCSGARTETRSRSSSRWCRPGAPRPPAPCCRSANSACGLRRRRRLAAAGSPAQRARP